MKKNANSKWLQSRPLFDLNLKRPIYSSLLKVKRSDSSGAQDYVIRCPLDANRQSLLHVIAYNQQQNIQKMTIQLEITGAVVAVNSKVNNVWLHTKHHRIIIQTTFIRFLIYLIIPCKRCSPNRTSIVRAIWTPVLVYVYCITSKNMYYW